MSGPPLRAPARLALALSGALLLTGCAGGVAAPAAGDAGAPQPGGTYTHALESTPSPQCFDAAQQRNHVALNAIRPLVDSLVDQDPETGEITPWLASSWETTDGSSYRFTLVENATFSDGLPVNAEAVKANLDRIAALGATAIGAQPLFEGYAGTDVESEFVATVRFDFPNAPFLQAAAGAWFGLISPADTGRTAEDLCSGDYAGSGPFVYEAFARDQEFSVTKRAGYDWAPPSAGHTGEAYLDRLVFSFVPEGSVRTGLLQSGQVESVSEIQPQDLPAIEVAGLEVITVDVPGYGPTYFANARSELGGDAAVRAAVQRGIDRQEVVDAIYGVPGFEPARSVLTPSVPYYVDLGDRLVHDPDGARAILDEAGWVPGPDGVRVKDGRRLEISVLGSSVFLRTQELIQQQLAAIGISAPIRQLDEASTASALAAGDYDFYQWTMTRADPDVLRAVFSSDHTAQGYALLPPSELDTYLDGQLAEVDPARRAELVRSAQEYIVDNAWAIPINSRARTFGLAGHAHGLRTDAESKLNFYDAWVESS